MDSNQNIQVGHFEYERDVFRPLDHLNHDMPESFYGASHQEDFSYEKNLRPTESGATVQSAISLPMTMCNHQADIPPRGGQNVNYYQEYCRLFIANVVLATQMKELVSEKNDLVNKLAKLEKNENPGTPNANTSEATEDKKKRFRRVATEIDRHYRCPVHNCQKSYGSEGSLNQHIKLKHPEIVKDPDFKSKLNQKDSDILQQKSETTN